MAVQTSMKHLLVMNDMYGSQNRSIIREALLTELNQLNRYLNAEIDRVWGTSVFGLESKDRPGT